MPRKATNPVTPIRQGPVEVPGSQAPVAPAKLLERVDELDNKYKLLTDTVSFVKDTNWVVLVVLALGFISLCLSAIFGMIQAWHSDATTQIELIRSMDNLTNMVNQATKSGGLK